jgi:hypothetical protein
MGKRKTGVKLPRVTVLAMNRNDLLKFVSAVDLLGFKVAELAAQVDRLKLLPANGRNPRKPLNGPSDVNGQSPAG